MIIHIELPDDAACAFINYFCPTRDGGATVRGLVLNDIAGDKTYTHKIDPEYATFEVGRCAECEHFRPGEDKEWPCSIVSGLPEPEEDDFCSYFERRKTNA